MVTPLRELTARIDVDAAAADLEGAPASDILRWASIVIPRFCVTSSFGADSAVIAAHCGAALMVVRRHATRTDAVQALTRSLANGPAKLAGVVMNEH